MKFVPDRVDEPTFLTPKDFIGEFTDDQTQCFRRGVGKDSCLKITTTTRKRTASGLSTSCKKIFAREEACTQVEDVEGVRRSSAS